MATRRPQPFDDAPEMCPVCKSNRYLRQGQVMEFLINSECYHSMCTTCVNRIFTSGPASCPVPHCGKTLRKKGFHTAFFGDLAIEREVDVRKRVGGVFNRRQDEFEDLATWNDYLEHVEDLIFDIVSGKPKERAKAEEKVRLYKEGNQAEIEENRLSALDALNLSRQRQQAADEAVKERRTALKKERQEEMADVERSQKEVLDQLASGDGDAAAITRRAQKVILKKTSARRTAAERAAEVVTRDGGLSIRGLKKRKAAEPEGPYDPFGGLELEPSMYVLQEHYENPWLDGNGSGGARADRGIVSGGWDVHDYYARTMFEAFSGLGVFVEDEVAERDQMSKVIGTAAAAEVIAPKASMGTQVKINRESDDVF